MRKLVRSLFQFTVRQATPAVQAGRRVRRALHHRCKQFGERAIVRVFAARIVQIPEQLCSVGVA